MIQLSKTQVNYSTLEKGARFTKTKLYSFWGITMWPPIETLLCQL